MTRKGQPNYKNRGSNNGMWKGDKVTYGGLHDYIKWNFPKPELCQICGIKPVHDLANISGKYERDISDWEWICRRCHMLKDGRLKPFLSSKIQKERNVRANLVRYGKIEK